MILRTVVMASGLCGALAAAQFPAYSQQYLQRLGGAVAALDEVVADFDASALGLGLSRQEALDQMTGSTFVDARRADMARTFARHAKLSADLAVLEGQGPFTRAYHATRMTDAQIARGAFAAFQPALPLTAASLLFAIVGFCVAAFAVLALRFLMARAWRKQPMPA